MNITFINISPNVARTYASAREFGIILRVRCPRDRGVSITSPPPDADRHRRRPEAPGCLSAGREKKKGATAVASSDGEIKRGEKS